MGAPDAVFSPADLAAARDLLARAQHCDTAYALVESLTTEVGPRLAGSPGDQAAREWALRNFSRLGFASARSMPVTVPVWSRGTAQLTVTSPYLQPLVALAIGGSCATPAGGIRATALAVRDLEELQQRPPQEVAGRIVFLYDRMRHGNDDLEYARVKPLRREGAAAAAALGAAAVVIRSIGTDSNRLAHTGSMAYREGVPRIPAVAISNPDADTLERIFAAGLPVTLELEVTATDRPPATSANIMAEIPGTTRAAEVVVFGAHLDCWDVGHGALDDGAGVAMVMATAQLLQDIDPPPRRTIRFVLFANEELGFSGAKAYAGQGVDEIRRHALAIEADLGAGPAYRLDSGVPPSLLPVVAAIQQVLAPLGVAPGHNYALGSPDVVPLHAAGVPVLELQLDATEYFGVYHSANDTLDKVDPEALRQALAAFATTVYLAARADLSFEHLPASR